MRNLLLPFIIVLIHTYMDTLRNDEDREINHHGKSIQINDESNENLQAGNTIKVLNIFFAMKTNKMLGKARTEGPCIDQ